MSHKNHLWKKKGPRPAQQAIKFIVANDKWGLTGLYYMAQDNCHADFVAADLFTYKEQNSTCRDIEGEVRVSRNVRKLTFWPQFYYRSSIPHRNFGAISVKLQSNAQKTDLFIFVDNLSKVYYHCRQNYTIYQSSGMYMVAKVNIQSKLERMLQATKAGVRPYKGKFRNFWNFFRIFFSN